MPLNSLAQGTNDGLGEEEVDLKSLYEMVSRQEKKSKALELYINYGAAAQATHDSRNDEWGARIYNRYLKIEIRGRGSSRSGLRGHKYLSVCGG